MRRDIILITDGEVSNPDAVIQLAAANRARQRVFSFGIGFGASSHLVKGVAQASAGASEMIQPGEKVQPKVLRQFSRLGQPVVENISVRFTGAGPAGHAGQNGSTVHGAHGALPPLFEGDSFVLFARVTDIAPGAEVELTGSVGGRQYRWSAPLVDLGHDNSIPCLWALQRIRHLEEAAPGGSRQTARRAASVRKEIEELGIRFNLLTDATSFVAIEERKEKDRTIGMPELRRVPIMMTKDWHGISEQQLDSGIAGMQVAPLAGDSLSAMLSALPDKEASHLLYETRTPAGIGSLMFANTDDASPIVPLEPDPWYLQLLATQNSQGAFEGLEIVAEHVGTPVAELEALALALEGTFQALRKKALTTWIAVRLLKNDTEAAAVSRRAILKAEKWLALHAPNLTMNGRPLEEHAAVTIKQALNGLAESNLDLS